LKSWKCSLYLFPNAPPFCPTYFMLQSGHVRLYMPLFSYCCCMLVFSGLGASLLLIYCWLCKQLLLAYLLTASWWPSSIFQSMWIWPLILYCFYHFFFLWVC
jgi:hypothetical protein